MDGFKEKKWFVYMGDHHEGPFSLEEIQGKMQAGLVTTSQYAWCEGMGDWRQITEIEAFQALLRQPPLRLVPTPSSQPPELREPTLTDATRMAPVTAEEGTIAVSRTDLSAQSLQSPEVAQAPASATLQADPTPVATSAQEVVTIAPHEPTIESSPIEPLQAEPRRSKKWVRPLLWVLLIASLAAAALTGVFDPLLKNTAVTTLARSLGNMVRPALVQLSERVPQISGWFSPIPHLEEISEADWPEFVDAARTPLAGEVPKVGLAVIQPDLLQPSFAITSAQPDGTEFELEIEGVPGTLLNHTDFRATAKVAIANRLGRSNPVRTLDGRPVPRGEYWVKVFEAGKLGQGQPLLKKGYFLGGVRDETYRERLKEYHVRLAEKAKAEREELKQFLASVEQQLQSSQTEFVRFRAAKGKKATPVAARAWASFHQKWTQFDAQLVGVIQTWTPEKLQSDTFYPMLYERVRQAAQQASLVHGLHHSWTTGAMNPDTFEQELQGAISSAQAAIQEAKAKVQQAEAIPASPTGMPRKDGL